ncbi:hypothetical protein [Methylobacterium sp. 77]|uniref:hypothetical protein n=1 Tax=Methylobacterium sp. 77 TaxID=1101192 RepID=UPI00037008C9|nr:hypothetical protein [Methylobacterium sp. 77]
MSFLIRASLVIGALSYLAAQRDDPASMARLQAPSMQQAVSAAWGTLPLETREKAASEGVDTLVRQVTGSVAVASRDTLAETDRRPAWHGVDGR